jgi:superfamily II DNA or RNA helicase
VDQVSLLSQWKKKHVSGRIGAGKNTLSGIIDIAVMQLLSRQKEVKEYVKNYGLIIADECHYASAFTCEQILKTTHAKYVYGLTATPTRKDGHRPIHPVLCQYTSTLADVPRAFLSDA